MATAVPLLALARLYQVGIIVPRLEDALSAYGPNERWRVWTFRPETLVKQYYRQEVGKFQMRIALNATDPQIELIEPLAGPSIYHEWMDLHGYGLHHLGFAVDDGAAAIQEMEKAGYDVIQSGFGFGSDGSGVFAYFDTIESLGFISEVIELPKERRTPELVWPPAASR